MYLLIIYVFFKYLYLFSITRILSFNLLDIHHVINALLHLSITTEKPLDSSQLLNIVFIT